MQKMRALALGLGMVVLAALAACEDGANETIAIPDIDSGLPDGSTSNPGIDAATDDAGTPTDASVDVDAAPPTPTCALTAPFTGSFDFDQIAKSATLTPDELEIIFVDSDGILKHGLRASKAATFTFITLPLTTAGNKVSVSMTANGLTLYVIAVGPGAAAPGRQTLYTTTRASRGVEFSPTPTALSLVQNVTGVLPTLNLKHDESGLYFTDAIGGSSRVRQITLPAGTLGDSQTVGNEVFVDPQPTFTKAGVVTQDGLHMITALTSVMVGGGPMAGTGRFAVADRAVVTAKFGTPAALLSPAHVDGTDDYPVWLSPDRCNLYYIHGNNLQIAQRVPTP